MKIVQINSTCGAGSTGKICLAVADLLSAEGVENYILYTCSPQSERAEAVRYSGDAYIKLQALKSRLFGNYGFNSKRATRRLIAKLKEISPDVVHLHNIHSHDCDIEMLFEYLKSANIKLYWTFHDCWAFTAYCFYFTASGCNKWQSGCKDCSVRRRYSWFCDRSKTLYERKKRLFSGLDMTIITPSQWLADLVGQSFLGDHPIKVINNGIDLSLFKPTASDIRERYGIGDKFLIMGCAFEWERRKGIDVFLKLEERLGEDYRILLVGTNDKVDATLPKNIISVHRTKNATELAGIYSAADLFVNPTREENYPTVNMEAVACGTPVLTFNTGGSTEMLDDTCGAWVKTDDLEGLIREIGRIKAERPYSEAACLDKARSFDMNERFKEYTELYGKN